MMELWVVLVAACIGLAAAADNRTGCGARADIIFVVDSSSSVALGNFNKTIQFVQSVVNDFKIGSDDVLVAVIKYSGSANIEFPLNRYLSKAPLLERISRIAFTGGATATGAALGTMLKQFSKTHGDRANAVNIGIVITDGQSGDVEKNAKIAKAQGIQMFAIGVGPGVVKKELQQIASGPSYVFSATDYKSLATIVNALSNKTCEVATKPPTTTSTTTPTTTTTTMMTTTPDCMKQAADIFFALDSSGSIGLPSYGLLKKFVTGVVQNLNVASDGIRVGLLRYSEKVTASFELNRFFNKALMLNAIQMLPYDARGTQTDVALEYLRKTGFTASGGSRFNVPKLAIVITDGQSTFPKSTEFQAKELKKAGVMVFAIGVGNAVDNTELENIASGKNFVFKVDNFQALSKINDSLQTLTCKAILATRPAITQPPSTTPRGCGDTTDDCDLFGRAVCTDYEPWARENCACYCNFCACPGSTTPCVDVLSNCAIYGDTLCIDPGYRPWVKQNCRKYCGMCNTRVTAGPGVSTRPPASVPVPQTTFPVPQPCIDTIPNCIDYGIGPCRDPNFADWVTKNCRKHCKRC